jgi:hypothetical protein
VKICFLKPSPPPPPPNTYVLSAHQGELIFDFFCILNKSQA